MTGRERQAAVDMTRGSPVKLILRFTLPLLIGQMMQQMREHLEQMQPEPPPAPEAKPEPAAKAPPKKRSAPRAGTAAKKKTT